MAAWRPRVALFGAGMISRAHGAAAAFGGMELVAVASRSPERAATRAAELGARAASYDDVLSGTTGADIVVVCTPPACHAADAIGLLERGVAVLVEKPLCRTLDEADAVVAAAARHGGRLLYGENLAYAPVVQHLLARATSLGPLRHLEVRSLQGLPTWGAFTSDDWGGGALFDLGVHPLAVALLAANASGAGMPTGVRARLRGGAGHASDEHAEVFLHYPTGLVARVEASWQHGPDAQWDAQLASDSGVLRAELLPEPTLEHNGDPVDLPVATVPVTAIEDYGYLAQLRAMVTAVQRGEEPLMNAAFGRMVLDVVCAAYRSAGRDGAIESLPFTGARNRTPLELWRGA